MKAEPSRLIPLKPVEYVELLLLLAGVMIFFKFRAPRSWNATGPALP